MLLQTMFQGTGIALLEEHMKALKSVRVGDASFELIEGNGLKPTSRGDRAVIVWAVDIRNQMQESDANRV
jgi:3-hydroxybutyryl-CoA dehydratase